MSTIFGKKVAVRLTNTIEPPYTIRKNTQVAEVSVVTPEQSNIIKPVDTAILSMNPEVGPDPTTYLNELFGTNKPEQQNNTFWSPTPSPGWIEDHNRIQTWTLKEPPELRQKKK